MFGKITIPKTINFTPLTLNSGPSINIGVPGCDEPLGPPAMMADVATLTNETILTKPIADLGGNYGCDGTEGTIPGSPLGIQYACGGTSNSGHPVVCNNGGTCAFYAYQTTVTYTWDIDGQRLTHMESALVRFVGSVSNGMCNAISIRRAYSSGSELGY